MFHGPAPLTPAHTHAWTIRSYWYNAVWVLLSSINMSSVYCSYVIRSKLSLWLKENDEDEALL